MSSTVFSKPVSDEIYGLTSNKLNKPQHNGTAGQLLRTNNDGTTYWDNDASTQDVIAAVTDWLDDNVEHGQTLVIDNTVSIQGAASDAKAVKDLLDPLRALGLYVDSQGYVCQSLLNES